MSTIKVLSPLTISRIAAGEVIERPASAIKELVENSIDANSDRIDVVIHNGGRNYISITDNGKGMNQDELSLCVERHATSKLQDENNLLLISSLGFRGEALPSIGSVSKLKITSRAKNSDESWELNVIGGDKQELIPASLNSGTRVEIRDLFFATPARLKFLKSERTEQQHIVEIVNRLAIAYPKISFTLKNEQKPLVEALSGTNKLLLERLTKILGKDFTDNAIEVSKELDGITISGFTALPTFNRGNSNMQYLFINNRPVRDRFLMGAIKAAYQDFLAYNRYPVFALFLDIPLDEVDVNVHPAKTEVRFRDNQKVRSVIIRSVKNAISSAGHRASTTVASSTMSAFKTAPHNNYQPLSDSASQQSFDAAPRQHSGYSSYSNHSAPRFTKADQISSDLLLQAHPHAPAARMDSVEQVNNQPIEQNNFPLGVARCQLHETYIVAQTENSIILVDQHAAHERLIYEKMKEQMVETGITRQTLLIPELIELPSEQLEIILLKAEELFNIGIIIEAFGENQIIVRETPALFGDINVHDLIKDLANDLIEYGDLLTAKDKFTDVCGTIACHSSIRAGRKLNILEMNQILRDMEKTPHSGQCNHGRPTYVELELKDIEKLFGRS